MEVTFVNSVLQRLRFALDLLDSVETVTLQPHFQFGEEEKVTRGQVGEIRRMRSTSCFRFAQEIACAEGVVSRCIAVMQHPVPVAPQ